jgi:S-(hydroxymethyl)glutathione dehydrogenase/alcohol dehydrogenase
MASKPSVSRRALLKHAAAAAAAGGATMIGAAPLAAQAGALAAGDRGPNVAGRKFRAVVSTGFGPNTTKLVDNLTLLPIGGRQVVIQTEASQCCYTMCARVLGTQDPPDPLGPQAPVIVNDPNEPTIQGHGGVGRVLAIGPDVKRVAVGDRVMVPVTAQCGQCYQCLHGRADRCQFGLGAKTQPIATMSNGTKVVQAGNIGGLADYMVAFEEAVIPIFSNAPSDELAMLHCVSGCGLGMTMTLSPIEPGSNVAVFGLGPVGLSAVQGARIMGAAQIIAVDPVKVRRDLAMKLGATAVLDPNVDKSWDLVARIKNMCKGTDRIYSAGRGLRPVQTEGRGRTRSDRHGAACAGVADNADGRTPVHLRRRPPDPGESLVPGGPVDQRQQDPPFQPVWRHQLDARDAAVRPAHRARALRCQVDDYEPIQPRQDHGRVRGGRIPHDGDGHDCDGLSQSRQS